MLVLSRYRDEVIMVGEVKITILKIDGKKVNIGIDAPKDVPVHRLEVYEAIKRESDAK